MTKPPRIDDELDDAFQDADRINGAQHGETHTRRPVKTETARSQGPKTRAANKERVKGSRLYNPR